VIRRLEVSGAAVDRGVIQGKAHRAEVARWIESQARPLGPLGALEARRSLRRGPALAMQRHLVQEHEFLCGIALGAGLPLGLVELGEHHLRVSGVGGPSGAELVASYDLPEDLLPLLLLRHTVPDAVGFESLELCAAPSPGCLAGVNAHGIAVMVLRDQHPHGLSLRALAQDLLFRSSEIPAGLRQLELRAGYAGGTGTLLLAGPEGPAVRVELEQGRMRSVRELAPGPEVAEPMLRIQLQERALTYRSLDGSEERVALEPASAAA